MGICPTCQPAPGALGILYSFAEIDRRQKRMRSTNFLLVEDDRNDALLVQEVFGKAHDCQLSVVQDGEEAIEYLLGKGSFHDRDLFPFPHVILLDLKMPKINGFEFLKWLRHDSPRNLRFLPVVVMSSSNHPKDVQRAYELGVNSYLLKPIQWTEFQARMEALNIFWTLHVEKPTVTR
jgi:CheY-like chemotaxis protein